MSNIMKRFLRLISRILQENPFERCLKKAKNKVLFVLIIILSGKNKEYVIYRKYYTMFRVFDTGYLQCLKLLNLFRDNGPNNIFLSISFLMSQT